jgi:hypothetical protein
MKDAMNRFGAVCACMLVAAAGVRADEVTLGAAKDNTLYQDELGSLSNGAGTGMFCGNTGRGNARRAVLAFDLSSIPAGSTITAVTLRLNVSMTISGDVQVTVHRLAASWGEGTSVALGGQGGGIAATPGDATWLHRFYDTTFWSTPGGDFNPTPSAVQTVGFAGPYQWSGAGLVADVQSWLNTPAQNFGWLVHGDEGVLSSAKRFDTHEHVNPDVRPKLIVQFTPPSTCYPDCNHDGILGLADFGCFQTKFALQDPYADCNGDGVLGLADFGCFQTKFALGCP